MRAVVFAAAAAVAAAQQLHNVAEEFVHQGYSAPTQILSFSAAMPWRNFNVLESELLARSTPGSPLYGKWLTMDAVRALTATDDAIRAEAMAFMTRAGATCAHLPHSLKCTAPVSAVEAMLATRVSAFKQTTAGGKLVHRVHPKETYTFPSEMLGKISFFTNLADFPTVRRRNGHFHEMTNGHLRATDGKTLRVSKSKMAVKKVGAVDQLITVEVINKIYDAAGVAGDAAATTAPAEFQGDASYAAADVTLMAKASGVADWKVAKTICPYAPANPDLEASLDEQYMGGVGEGNTQWYWTEVDWMLEWTEAMQKPGTALPQVFSVSWGWSEADQCMIDPSGPCKTNPKNSAGYVAQVNQGFAAVTATGVSIVISSGDSGAHGRTDPTCTSKATLPDWPTACPYITAVGATQFINETATAAPTSPICKNPPAGFACPGKGNEVTCSPALGALIASGGGFSNVAARLSYQDAAVAGYVSQPTKVPAAGDFNATGRAYPDVSALGHNYIIWASGQSLQVDGTSCSAPVFGAIVGFANAARAKAGKPALGFLNPALYGAPKTIFHDITVGDNSCTEDGCTKGCSGFTAAVGFDAATGLGRPVISKFVAYMATL
jgi:tripeptidyl-peptidase-1